MFVVDEPHAVRAGGEAFRQIGKEFAGLGEAVVPADGTVHTRFCWGPQHIGVSRGPRHDHEPLPEPAPGIPKTPLREVTDIDVDETDEETR